MLLPLLLLLLCLLLPALLLLELLLAAGLCEEELQGLVLVLACMTTVICQTRLSAHHTVDTSGYHMSGNSEHLCLQGWPPVALHGTRQVLVRRVHWGSSYIRFCAGT